MMTLAVLFFLNIIYAFFAVGCSAGWRKLIDSLDSLKSKAEQNFTKKDTIKKISNLLIVATLIAGVAFAASVQIASNSDTNSSGGSPPPPPPTPVRKETALRMFTVCNTIAMYSSITAAILLCWTQLHNRYLASLTVGVASLLIAVGLYTSCLAFFASICILTGVGKSFIVNMMVLQSLLLWFPAARLSRLFLPSIVTKLYIFCVFFYQGFIYYVVWSVYHVVVYYLVYSVSLVRRK